MFKKTGRRNGSAIKVAYLFKLVLAPEHLFAGDHVNICNFHTTACPFRRKMTTPARDSADLDAIGNDRKVAPDDSPSPSWVRQIFRHSQ
jgi:hypothetical protein